MMRRCAGLDPDETRRQLLEESNDIAALQLAPDDHIAFRVNAMDLVIDNLGHDVVIFGPSGHTKSSTAAIG